MSNTARPIALACWLFAAISPGAEAWASQRGSYLGFRATRCDTPDGQARSLFVIENADGSSAPVEFPGRMASDAGPGVIAATLDPERGLLREQWQSRVLPPPGTACTGARLWGWTGHGFELAEERQSLRCAGEPGHWLARSFARSLVTPAAPGIPAAAAAFSTSCEGP